MYQGRYQTWTPARKQSVRRRKPSKYFWATLSLILLLGVAAGSTIAYIIATGETVKNSFVPGNVLCSVNDSFEITNDGNVDAYIRAAVIINWENAAGDINGFAPKEGTDYTLALDATWERVGDYYYYKGIVTPEGNSEKTTPVATVTPVGDAPTGFELVVEVLAEAIQAEGMGADSARNAWEKAQQNG